MRKNKASTRGFTNELPVSSSEELKTRDRLKSGVMLSLCQGERHKRLLKPVKWLSEISACVGKWPWSSIWKCLSGVHRVTGRCLAVTTSDRFLAVFRDPGPCERLQGGDDLPGIL